MAMVRFGEGIVEMEGKLGGGYYRFDWCRQHIQAMPRVCYIATPARILITKRFQSVLNYLKQYPLTQHQIELWDVYSRAHPHTSPKGMVYIWPWRVMFFSVNLIALRLGLGIYREPPKGEFPPPD